MNPEEKPPSCQVLSKARRGGSASGFSRYFYFKANSGNNIFAGMLALLWQIGYIFFGKHRDEGATVDFLGTITVPPFILDDTINRVENRL